MSNLGNVPDTPKQRRPTIRDVAREAGVSRGTVSRVLNGAHLVSGESLAAVTAAIERTGFSANQHARSLATGRANSIAFLLTESQDLLFDDPNFSALLRGCAAALSKLSIPLVLMFASSAEERRQTIEFISGGHVDGVLLVSSHAGDPVLPQLLKAQIPVVASGRPLGFERKIGYVGADDYEGARQMTQHLLDGGRRRIATITGPLDTSGGVDRLAGYQAALGDAVDPALIVSGDYTRQSGEKRMLELLEAAPDLDAVFVASDLMAVGALTVLRQAGREVPGDVAVAGFDDAPLASSVDPLLTTVHQPLDRIGAEMVRLLVEVIDGNEPLAVIVPTHLVIRQST